MPSFKKSLIVEQCQGNYLKRRDWTTVKYYVKNQIDRRNRVLPAKSTNVQLFCDFVQSLVTAFSSNKHVKKLEALSIVRYNSE